MGLASVQAWLAAHAPDLPIIETEASTATVAEAAEAPTPVAAAAARTCCPRGGTPGLVRKEGCDTCFECGYSKCG